MPASLEASRKRDGAVSEHPIYERLIAMRGPAERAANVLDMLATRYRVEAGCLFGVAKGGLSLLASIGKPAGDEQLRALIAAFLAAELTDTEVVTVTQADERAAAGATDI